MLCADCYLSPSRSLATIAGWYTFNMSPSLRTPHILLLSGALVLIASGFLVFRWWIGSLEHAALSSPEQLLTETEKLQVVHTLSASASTTATAQQKASVLQALQKVDTSKQQEPALSNQEKVLKKVSSSKQQEPAISNQDKLNVLQALHAPN